MKKRFSILFVIIYLQLFLYSGIYSNKSFAIEQINTSSNKREVYLTFDDGPSSLITPLILKILKKHNIRATFFIVGKEAEIRKEIIKKMYTEGHTVGLHCYEHNYKKIYQNIESFNNDLNKCKSVIKSILKDYTPKLYRFPGGSFTVSDIFKDEILKQGLTFYDWNSVNNDTLGEIDIEKSLQAAINTSANRRKVILLMHDNKNITANVLSKIISYYKSEGYIFKNL